MSLFKKVKPQFAFCFIINKMRIWEAFLSNFLPATLQWLLPVTYKQDTEKICEVTWSLSYSLNVPSLIAQHMVVGSEWSAVTGCRHGTFIFCRGILMQIGCQFLAFTYYGKFVNLFCFFLLFFSCPSYGLPMGHL